MIGRHSEAEASAEGAHLVDGRLVERRRNMRIRRFMVEVATFLFVAMMAMSVPNRRKEDGAIPTANKFAGPLAPMH